MREWAIGQAGPAATLGQHCPQMTQRPSKITLAGASRYKMPEKAHQPLFDELICQIVLVKDDYTILDVYVTFIYCTKCHPVLCPQKSRNLAHDRRRGWWTKK